VLSMCAGLNLGNAWLFSLSPGELIMEFDGSSGKAEGWGQACDFCDFGFDSTGCSACAPGAATFEHRTNRRPDHDSAPNTSGFTRTIDTAHVQYVLDFRVLITI